jgi:hypothetical protein
MALRDVFVDVETAMSEPTKKTIAKVCDVYAVTADELNAAAEELESWQVDGNAPPEMVEQGGAADEIDSMPMQSLELAQLIALGLRAKAKHPETGLETAPY